MLHTLSASPTSSAFADCLRLLCEDDALVLMGDAVYCALLDSTSCDQLVGTNVQLHLLKDDAVAAGILDRVGDTSLINIDQLVELSERHARQQAWY